LFSVRALRPYVSSFFSPLFVLRFVHSVIASLFSPLFVQRFVHSVIASSVFSAVLFSVRAPRHSVSASLFSPLFCCSLTAKGNSVSLLISSFFKKLCLPLQTPTARVVS
jgi:hypothetical protein